MNIEGLLNEVDGFDGYIRSVNVLSKLETFLGKQISVFLYICQGNLKVDGSSKLVLTPQRRHYAYCVTRCF